MMEIKITPFIDISPHSKKIKKSLGSPESPMNFSDDAKKKKYNIVNSKVKGQAVLDIKKGILLMIDLDKETKPLSSKRFYELVEEVPLKEYNKLLSRVLIKHIGKEVLDSKSLNQWRRKIKSWIKKTTKPEKRGGVIIADKFFDEFMIRLKDIIRNLGIRSFQRLRGKVLDLLEDFHNSEPLNQGKPFNRNTSSKHWWFDFIKKHLDLKELWECLPLERSRKVKLTSSVQANYETKLQLESTESSCSSTYDRINVKMEEEEQHQPKLSHHFMSFPIFSDSPILKKEEDVR